MARISKSVREQIIRELKAKRQDGCGVHTYREIADKHEISLTSLYTLSEMAETNGRKRGPMFHLTPNGRIMKILRDATEPGITFEEVGRRNPRMVHGRLKPITKSRVSAILAKWKEWMEKNKISGKGFKAGDIIEWADQRFKVMRVDDARHGAAVKLVEKNGKWEETADVIDPFCWVHLGTRSKLVRRTKPDKSEQQEAVSNM